MDFHRSMFSQGNIRDISVTAVMTAVQLIFYFSITYFIYKAFGLKGDKW